MGSKTLRLSAVAAVLITATLLVGFVLGAINADQLKSTLGKTLAVIAIIALASVAAVAITSNKQQ
jgi:Na+-driven multidrug efflux pump